MGNFRYTDGDPLQIGRIKFEYRVLGLIGHGPYSEVYRVEKALGEEERGKIFAAKVAVFPKDVLSPLSFAQYADTMEAGVAALKGIESGNIARVHDFVAEEKDEEVVSCIIIDNLGGESLAERVRQRFEDGELKNDRMAAQELEYLLPKVCTGLAALHDKEMVHGNLKPQNIFIGDDGRVKLTDVDVANLLGKQRSRHSDKETPASQLWLSPEQLDASGYEPDPRSDIWSFGIIMFQLMGGTYPFAGDTVKDIVHNLKAKGVNRKALDYLPDSLSQLLDHCLQKDPEGRYGSIHTLARHISVGEFIKRCANNHPNQYWELQCSDPLCNTGFSRPGANPAYNLHGGWIEYTDVPESLAVDDEKSVFLRIWPGQNPNKHAIAATGQDVRIRFQSSDDPQFARTELCVPLLPRPEFDVEPAVTDIELDPMARSPLLFLGLKLLRSEVLIESIEAYLDKNSAFVALVDSDALRQTIKARPEPYDVQLMLDTSKLQKEKTYELSFRLHLKNRKKPVLLDSYRLEHPLELRVVNPPKLGVLGFSEDAPIKVKVYRGGKERPRDLEVINVGGGQLRLKKIIPFQKGPNGKEIEAKSVIWFDTLEQPFDVRRDIPSQLGYTIEPDAIFGDHLELSLRFVLIFYKDGLWEEERRERRFIIDVQKLGIGRVLAVDFGTTNSYCAAFTKGWRNQDIEELDLYDEEKDKSIPSVIEYFCRREQITIGKEPYVHYKAGSPNVFRSFKRHIGNPHKLYPIFPPDGQEGFSNYRATILTRHFLEVLREKAQKRLGCRFNSFIFTHPSKFPYPKLRALRKLLEQADLSPYELLDEATASALPFIARKQGTYGLLVHDFGGGTIDITYLLVKHNAQHKIHVEILDRDGLPDFGGDDVTNAIQEIILSRISRELPKIEILLPDTHRTVRLNPAEDRLARKNAQGLWGLLEAYKKANIFKQTGEQQVPIIKLYAKDWATGEIKDLEERSVSIRQGEINGIIYKRIADSIGIVQEIFENDKKRTDDKGANLTRYIILSGRSSRIPLLKEIFEAFKVGKRPDWDDSKKEVVFNGAQAGESPLPRLEYDELIYSDRPKANVALGAAHYYRAIKERKVALTVTGHEEKNWSRFGLLAGGIYETVFEEWIPKNGLLTPPGRRISPSNKKEFEKYAAEEKHFSFSFNSNNDRFYSQPIEVYEHFGRDNIYNDNICVRVGTYVFEKPADCNVLEPDGILRMEFTEDRELKLEANIWGTWIDGIDCIQGRSIRFDGLHGRTSCDDLPKKSR